MSASYTALAISAALLVCGSAQAQILSPLTTDQIAAATKDAKHKGYYTTDGTVFTTPYARVVWAAKQAAKDLTVFNPPGVDDDMVGPYIEIECEPHAVNSRYRPPSVVSPRRVVLIPRGSTDVATAIQPLSEERIPREFKNAMGGVWTGQALRARFPIESFTEGMEVVIVNDDSDHQYRKKVKLKDVK